MSNISIRPPFLERRKDNLHITKGPLADDGTTVFNARSFVFANGSNLLVPVLTAGVVCMGWSADGNHLATPTPRPPDALYGNLHWVFDPRDAQFSINITNNAATIGAGAPALSSILIGEKYGIIRPTTGAATGIQMLNQQDTTNDFFRVVAIYPGQASTDLNGIVLVELIDAVIQG